MTLRAYKFLVQAVLLDEQDGAIVGEKQTPQTVLYGDTLAAVAADFDKQLAESLKEIHGS